MCQGWHGNPKARTAKTKGLAIPKEAACIFIPINKRDVSISPERWELVRTVLCSGAAIPKVIAHYQRLLSRWFEVPLRSQGVAEGPNYPFIDRRENESKKVCLQTVFHMQTKSQFQLCSMNTSNLAQVDIVHILMHSNRLDHWGMCSVYLYSVLYMTCGVFCSLMTILILFITKERHPQYDVDTYCSMGAAQRCMWRDIPRQIITKPKSLLYLI